MEWRISGYALVKNRNRILMVMPTWNNQFELPGGGVEEQESLKEGIIRECYEETGYKISIADTTPIYIGEENFYHRHLDKFYHSLIIVYQAKLKNHKQNLEIINTQVGIDPAPRSRTSLNLNSIVKGANTPNGLKLINLYFLINLGAGLHY